MVERIKAVIVIVPLLFSIVSLVTALDQTDGQFAIASAFFYGVFVASLKFTYGTK